MADNRIVQLTDEGKNLFPIPSTKGPDINNVLYSVDIPGKQSRSYTATQDCYLLANSSGGAWAVYVDGVSLGGVTTYVSLHSGQVATVYQYYEYGASHFTIYGVKYS